MELLIFIDALRRASAEEIIAVIPYYGTQGKIEKLVRENQLLLN